MSAFLIPKAARLPQTQAANPQSSVWVSANAGSGKTHVLTERVIRLLLEGTEPQRILCLTYTKAAAAVMQKRIFNTLSGWTALNDSDLKKELQSLEGKIPNAKRLVEARRLFARALETPGGLKIQTIHAFCESLLHQFPLEANIAGHFELIDDLKSKDLFNQARRTVIEKAYLKKDHDLYEAFMLVLKTVGETGLNTLFSEAIANRQDLKSFLTILDQDEGFTLLENRLKDVLSIEDNDQIDEIYQQLRLDAILEKDVIEQYNLYGNSSTGEFMKHISLIEKAKTDEAFVAAVRQAYFTKDNARSIKRLTSKKLCEINPSLQDDILKRQDAVSQHLRKIQSLQLVPLNVAAFRLCAQLLNIYDQLKKAEGLLDFNDLIERTLILLEREGAGQWVHYKLDQGIDHILVDEAQDTSPSQWKIIQLLAQEFFVGKGQRDCDRTLFAVGDEKQSIYSFQGAVPQDFDYNGRLVEKAAASIKHPFEKLKLNYSFRSTQDVLKSVDKVFENPENYKGLSVENIKTVHDAIRLNDNGEVEIWDMFTPDEVQEPEDWRKPVDQLHAPAVKLAEEIANRIKSWLHKGEVLSGKGRLMKASDIMILVRKRDQFVPALSRALKNRAIPVAGADRLQLTHHIAVRDLMALGRFVLQPKDDLSLAAVLKSPLFGLNENDLYLLSQGREASLWQSLKKHASDHMHFNDVYQSFMTYRQLADKMPVFEFFSYVLNKDEGRKKILARLGSEASEILDAFMDYALEIQKKGLPGLQAFLEILEAMEPEIKRELDQNREEVRIMTVHAAKGLEAAVVFLVDSNARIWNTQHEPKLLKMIDKNCPMFLWQPNEKYKTLKGKAFIEGLNEKAQEEYRRLLYVGMTRAEDRLIVCGYHSKQKNINTWHELVAKALVPHSTKIAHPLEGVEAWRFCVEGKPIIQKKLISDKGDDRQFPVLPDYFKTRLAPQIILPKPLTPSKALLEIDDAAAGDETIMMMSPILDVKHNRTSFAIERGNIMHSLLQYLPQCDENMRKTIAQNYVNKVADTWSEQQKQNMINDVFAVIRDPNLQGLFSSFSRAEVSLMGVVKIKGKEYSVSGKIDRLIDEGERITIADFKTGHVPENDEAIAPAYIRQMALYQKLLNAIDPHKTVQSLLIYTNGPKIFKLNTSKIIASIE
ncbi:double-strand break repair helicase AddA [Bartonella tamiae]|uniref:DNA 3'-5' helicase n=1 Tax=Bartonella tamiae Th239 TaxID=1094558 RepID=J0ZR04_9HYPH|nr:double-strand break repair helicase AddA [Bartonella tamiae]EJF91113.1 double-strand break repair helicase AddA [Bartonella tamiae Th239]EJF93222.1 double-strand break repair helicase AddA [Bartonella tamiae Th307]